jgi:superfamily II DNA/RNA helicase
MDMYIHRIGRCGRAGQSGRAHTFVTDSDLHLAPLLVDVLTRNRQK